MYSSVIIILTIETVEVSAKPTATDFVINRTLVILFTKDDVL